MKLGSFGQNILLTALCRKFRERRGDAYIEVIVKVIVVLMALLLVVSTFSVVMSVQRLNSAADEVGRMIEVDGKFDASENQKAQQLLDDNGISGATVSCTASGNIQINTSFAVTIKENAKLGIGGVSVLSVPLTGQSTGFSNVYWK